VKRRARRGATARHIRWVWGKPCSSSTGGPDPDQRTKTVVSAVSISELSNSSNILGTRVSWSPPQAGSTSRPISRQSLNFPSISVSRVVRPSGTQPILS
jgi:hypothetical protein